LGLVEQICSHRTLNFPSPLFLHGPAGTGKSHLVSALVNEVTRRAPQLVVRLLAASDLAEGGISPFGNDSADATEAEKCQSTWDYESSSLGDLLIVEDLQHLPTRAAETFVQGMDYLHARQCPMVFTALAGPRHLTNLPARITSRLVGGLVVGLEALSAPSRLILLDDKAQRRQLAVSRNVLAWLAERLTGGGRQLEGAIGQLEALSRLNRHLDVATVVAHFSEQVEESRPTVERIAQRVGGYFRVETRQLRSRLRSRQVLLPRQVGMYLARQLTKLSLEQIGAYFGGRDHSTVLHACRKVEQALTEDAVLSGAVQQLHSDLA
jgi:chromosomal replication initiator protein